MRLVSNGKAVPFFVESSAYEGVRRVAGKIAADVQKVAGVLPQVLEGDWNALREERLVICATLGKSALIDRLCEQGKIDCSALVGKWECYGTYLVSDLAEGIGEALIICGSDKRGTIYGMFALSEYIGVSPLCYWGDVEPQHKDLLEVEEDFVMVSREPSVKYRGFFINDEWPCFGNWTFDHFGGFNAEMYDHVFELLLRLKGNYMWPAMWTSSFPLDGPGSLNEELADIYGIVIGYSHHEPCLRASEEWDKVRGEESVYGNEWNFYTNRAGITQYWEDGLKRSGKYEHMVTIGMRGERDSSMLGDDATLKQNIDLLKDIITVQRALIRENVNADIRSVPQILALYKEVEPYFYGDSETEGLKDWEELTDVICMLCEDNFGYMRTLPTEELRRGMAEKNCGFGMYYHLDYHGGPVSYEWQASTPFSMIWEQMCMAYDYGIRDAWIVNVGDLKGNEVGLSYFMALAYDYEKWGSSNRKSGQAYTKQWLAVNFPGVDGALCQDIGEVLTGFMEINHMRRPEALHAGIYHPCHYLETDRMLEKAAKLDVQNEENYRRLKNRNDGNAADAYYSMIYFAAKASINLLRMHLYVGKNEHYAKQGKPVANRYAQYVTECIAKDKRLAEEFAHFRDGKWKGMELEAHIGFVKWNDDNCRYPLRIQVEPAVKPRLTVSRKDAEEIATKTYGVPMSIRVDDFLSPARDSVILELANDGVGTISYQITGWENVKWLSVSPAEGVVAEQQEVILTCDRSSLTEERQTAELLISDGETMVTVEVSARSWQPVTELTFMPDCGVISIDAVHYAAKKDLLKGSFVRLDGYGNNGCGMKVFPLTAEFAAEEEKPELTYRFWAEKAGDYAVELWTSPSNPVRNASPLRVMLGIAGEKPKIVEMVTPDFKAGDPRDEKWCQGVLDQARITRTRVTCKEGMTELVIGAMDAGVVLERILIYPQGCPPKKSYLGPQESFYTGADRGMGERDYRNLFREIGIANDEILKRLEQIKQTFFYGKEDERLYHPVGADMAYIEDTGNHDARTEGMSYGMMLCVQLDMKEEFDRLWKWAKTYMWMDSGENEGYFAWSCATDGTKNAMGPAPDGEEYFAMALFFASHRWGDGTGIFAYSKEAKDILRACLHKGESGRAGAPMWNRENHQILFVPGIDFTDPSYHLPHFYELFGEWAYEEDRKFFKCAAQVSREYLAKACHPVTGFSAEYAEFDGAPMNRAGWGGQRHDWFFSDSYRTVANIGLDYLWFGRDEGQCAAAEHIQTYLLNALRTGSYCTYEVDGRIADENVLHPVGITATVAQASLATHHECSTEWIKRFWELPLRAGARRYYDNCLYFFAFLALSGNYRIW